MIMIPLVLPLCHVGGWIGGGGGGVQLARTSSQLRCTGSWQYLRDCMIDLIKGFDHILLYYF